MRLSRSTPDSLDPGPQGYAHRGLHEGLKVPENTLAAFAAALAAGAGIECDLRLTADDEILVFHDADARRLCGDDAVIGRSPAKELTSLRVGSEPIPTLRQLLDLIVGKAPMLLEAKVDGDRRRWAAALARALDSYPGPFGVMSFDPGVIRLVRRLRPGWQFGLVIADRLDPVRRAIALRIASPHFLAVETKAALRPWVASERRQRPVYSWTVRTPEQRTSLLSAVDALIWEGDGRP